jgi:hypothetical protein
MTRQEASELLDLIVENAPRLRAAGIRAVNVGGASFTLAPAEIEPDGDESETEPAPSDVLHDSWTYGVPPSDGAPRILPKRERRPL